MALTSVVIKQVAKRYGMVRAVANVSLTLNAGSVCALLGHNGAGKTTLLGMLSTLVTPSAGTITYLDGATPMPQTNQLRREIGMLAHASLCYADLTAEENLYLFAELYGLSASTATVAAMLDEVGLAKAARRRPAKTYSRGMVQRLALARALLPGPSLVLLDEPFTGLDRGGAMALGQTIAKLKARGAIVVVITHDLEAIAETTNHVCILRRGALAHEVRTAEDAAGYSYTALKDLYHAHGEAAA